jgi:hypothetical protein
MFANTRAEVHWMKLRRIAVHRMGATASHFPLPVLAWGALSEVLHLTVTGTGPTQAQIMTLAFTRAKIRVIKSRSSGI